MKEATHHDPFISKYDIQNHIAKTKYLIDVVCPEAKKTGNVYMGYTGELSFKDLRDIFRKRGTDNLTQKEIENSISNRAVMLSEMGPKVDKLIRKLAYGVRILSGESSFNWLPIGIVHDSPAPQAEDRGHEGTLLFCEWETEWTKKTWKRVVKKLDDRTDKTPNLNQLIDSIKFLLNKKSISKFSLSQIVPAERKDDIDNYMINIEYKVYPSRKYHDNEILGINEQEDEWQTHQIAMKPVERQIRERLGARSEKLYEIYNLVKDSDLFLGNDLVFKSHRSVAKKMEMPEEEILWLYGSSICSRKGYKEKYRGFICTNVDTRSKAYATAILEYPTTKDWKVLVNHINWTYTSLLPVKMFQNAIDEMVEHLESKGISATNVKDLSPKKVDAALMFVEVTKEFVDNNGNLTQNMFAKCANIVFKIATELVSDKVTMEALATSGKGAKARAQQFFSPLVSRLDELTSDDINDSKDATIKTCLEIIDEQKISMFTNKDVAIFDRDENAKDIFHIRNVKIFDAKGLDNGHIIAGQDSGGFFLQPHGDNTFWKDKRDFTDLKAYAVEYIKSVKDYLDSINPDWEFDDDLDDAYQNTKKFVKYWGYINE